MHTYIHTYMHTYIRTYITRGRQTDILTDTPRQYVKHRNK